MRGVKSRPPSLCQGIWSGPPSRILRKNLLTACLWSFNLQRQKRTRFCCLSHSACRALSPATLGNECGRSLSVWATVTRGHPLGVSEQKLIFYTSQSSKVQALHSVLPAEGLFPGSQRGPFPSDLTWSSQEPFHKTL